jgi:Co/Zn/Cd efflux system component
MLVLGIHAVMFVFESALGVLGQSTGLIADSLNMFADASVYAMSLYAVGNASGLKIRSARLSGFAQFTLSALVLAGVVRNVILGSEPMSALMMGESVIALVANATCLLLLARHRDGGVHMRASAAGRDDSTCNVGHSGEPRTEETRRRDHRDGRPWQCRGLTTTGGLRGRQCYDSWESRCR